MFLFNNCTVLGGHVGHHLCARVLLGPTISRYYVRLITTYVRVVALALFNILLGDHYRK